MVNLYTDIQQIVSKAADALLAIDKGMVVELCILGEDFGPFLVKGMQQKIMATPPAKEFRLSFEDLFSRMNAIKESKFFSTCPLVGQQDLLSVMDLVGNTMNSISPDKDMVKSNDTFFTQVFTQLGLFLAGGD